MGELAPLLLDTPPCPHPFLPPTRPSPSPCSPNCQPPTCLPICLFACQLDCLSACLPVRLLSACCFVCLHVLTNSHLCEHQSAGLLWGRSSPQAMGERLCVTAQVWTEPPYGQEVAMSRGAPARAHPASSSLVRNAGNTSLPAEKHWAQGPDSRCSLPQVEEYGTSSRGSWGGHPSCSTVPSRSVGCRRPYLGIVGHLKWVHGSSEFLLLRRPTSSVFPDDPENCRVFGEREVGACL